MTEALRAVLRSQVKENPPRLLRLHSAPEADSLCL
jgi:hypothetical protein